MIGFDTNVLLYASNNDDPIKHEAASRLFMRAITERTAFVPLQVFAEFINAAQRKLRWATKDTIARVEAWRQTVGSEPYNEADLEAAIEAHRDHRLPIWDALIWAVCDRAGARILATEDFQDGRTLGRVTFVDPFNPANAARLGLA